MTKPTSKECLLHDAELLQKRTHIINESAVEPPSSPVVDENFDNWLSKRLSTKCMEVARDKLSQLQSDLSAVVEKLRVKEAQRREEQSKLMKDLAAANDKLDCKEGEMMRHDARWLEKHKQLQAYCRTKCFERNTFEADLAAARAECERLRGDSDRLTYLITDSWLDNSEGFDLGLIVTKDVVKSCSGTWKDDYQNAVRKAIDKMQPLPAAPKYGKV